MPTDNAALFSHRDLLTQIHGCRSFEGTRDALQHDNSRTRKYVRTPESLSPSLQSGSLMLSWTTEVAILTTDNQSSVGDCSSPSRGSNNMQTVRHCAPVEVRSKRAVVSVALPRMCAKRNNRYVIIGQFDGCATPSSDSTPVCRLERLLS